MPVQESQVGTSPQPVENIHTIAATTLDKPTQPSYEIKVDHTIFSRLAKEMEKENRIPKILATGAIIFAGALVAEAARRKISEKIVEKKKHPPKLPPELSPEQQKRFADAVDKHMPSIYGYIQFRIGDVQLSEDITQKVFLQAFNAYGRFKKIEDPANPEYDAHLAWFYTIARNLLANHFRDITRKPPPADIEKLIHEPKTDTVEPLEEDPLISWLREALGSNEITEDQRLIYYLDLFENWPNVRIAKVLGKSVGAVKSAKNRAKEKLQKLLKTHQEEMII